MPNLVTTFAPCAKAARKARGYVRTLNHDTRLAVTRGESNENAFTRVGIQERRLKRSFPSFCSLFSRGFKRGKKGKEKGGERDGERRPGGRRGGETRLYTGVYQGSVY